MNFVFKLHFLRIHIIVAGFKVLKLKMLTKMLVDMSASLTGIGELVIGSSG